MKQTLSILVRLLAGALLVAFLLPARAQVLGANDKPIHDAARLGTDVEVLAILKADATARDARTSGGATPVHLAATNVNPAALKALIAAGANVNARDNEGVTPLHMAAYTQRTAQARLLLEAGADPLAKTHAGRDVLSLARKVMAHETAGVISLWLLKGCQAGKPC